MMTLNESYFNSPKRFRLEWQPGPEGYVHWYVDGQFRFGVEAEGLSPHLTKIPDEPSYIIMNTAISTSWGFPNPPLGCTEYDCKTTEGQCGMNPGFCKSLPAKFLIDSVRVYQNKDDPYQNVGCNPKDRPTRYVHKYSILHSTCVQAFKAWLS
jgi:beta-glucan synthesis-associated protein KRE6